MLYIQANHELIDGQYITYCAYLFCKVVYDGFLYATGCILRFLVPILHVMQRKTAIRSRVPSIETTFDRTDSHSHHS